MGTKNILRFLLIFVLVIPFDKSLSQDIDTLLMKEYYSRAKNPLIAELITLFIPAGGHVYVSKAQKGCSFSLMEFSLVSLLFYETFNNVDEPGNQYNKDELYTNFIGLSLIGLKMIEYTNLYIEVGHYNRELAKEIFGKPMELKYNHSLVINNKIIEINAED